MNHSGSLGDSEADYTTKSRNHPSKRSSNGSIGDIGKDYRSNITLRAVCIYGVLSSSWLIVRISIMANLVIDAMSWFTHI